MKYRFYFESFWQLNVFIIDHMFIHPQNKEGFPLGGFRLTHGDRHLRESDVISDTSIANNSTLHLHFSLLGGSTGPLGKEVLGPVGKRVLTPIHEFPRG